MADDTHDQHHRRRLFGRRRGEPESAEPLSESSPPEPDDEAAPSDMQTRDAAEAPAAAESIRPEPEPEVSTEPEPEPDSEPEPEPAAAADPPAPPAPEPDPAPAAAPVVSPPATSDEAPVAAAAPSASTAAGSATPVAAAEEPAASGEVPPEVPPSEGQPAGNGDEVAPIVLPRVIAIANQKGGVGKTTTAVNLGAALAEADFRVLVVDLDPQGNATTGLGVNPRDVQYSIYDVIMNDTPAVDAVEPTSLKNLFVIPATLDLAGAEIELVPAFSREQKLKRALDAIREDYDLLFIDCPPSLGLLTVNGLAAADDVIVPIQCEYYALEGLGQLLRNVASVRNVLNPTLDVRGIVLTMHDTRTRLADQVETEVREHFGTRVYKTVVPRTVRLAEAPSFGQPIIVFDPTSKGAKAYRKLAKEVSSGATRRTG
jgi:chromosome partitioning protein